MTAAANTAPEPSAGRDPLHPHRATPTTIRAALLPEDREQFDAAYTAALDTARESLDLTELHEMVESWRRIAVVQRDPADFRRIARRVAELLTGQPSPDDEPLAVTRVKAGM